VADAEPGTVFDLVVLGAGSGGYACALRAAQLGKSVALIEKDRLGGTCLHQGCIPTKALLHAAEVADAARDGAALGLSTRYDGVDMPALLRYQRRVVDRLHQGLSGLIAAAPSLTVVTGAGRLVDAHTVEVDRTRYRGTNVVLATGSVPRTLGVEIGGRVVTSDQALTLEELPERVVVIGGSVIGVEFASVWTSLGAHVTVVEALDRLVPLEDRALSKALERAFRKRSISVRTGVKFTDVTQDADAATVRLEDGSTLEADLVLIAVGRAPRTDGMGFAEADLQLDRGWVVTDERLRTNLDGVYAVGDLVAGLQLAHRGFAHGIFVAEDIAGLAPAPVADSSIPRVTYCEPEVASVGLTEEQARERFGDVDVVEYNLAGNGRSQILQTSGLVKLVRHSDGPIVGVHMIGARMGEQIGEGALLVNWEAYPEDIAPLIHAPPTQNESLGEAALALAGKPLHSHA